MFSGGEIGALISLISLGRGWPIGIYSLCPGAMSHRQVLVRGHIFQFQTQSLPQVKSIFVSPQQRVPSRALQTSPF